MSNQSVAPAVAEPQHNVFTLVAIGALACIAADMVHEALGHGTVSLLLSDPILSLSTVAVQNARPSRLVAAAGTIANLIVGVSALLLLRRFRRLTPSSYFVWVFGAFNLFNVGYLIVSACMNSGDWAAVTSGISPPWPLRGALGGSGIVLYVLSVRWVATFPIKLLDLCQISIDDGERLIWPAYLASGVVLTVASLFNPISPNLILVSGIGASLGLNCGFLFIPGIIARRATHHGVCKGRILFNSIWVIGSVLLSGLFIGILGPGIHFSN